MGLSIAKVCVLGAGTMGAGIAAQVANAGVPVLLLDMATDGPDRSIIARSALERLGKAEPAAFMSKAAARLVDFMRGWRTCVGQGLRCPPTRPPFRWKG
jgi:3-hydroxyacyl-CoA dehydrogenase